MQDSSKIVQFECNPLLHKGQLNQSFSLGSYFLLHSLHLVNSPSFVVVTAVLFAPFFTTIAFFFAGFFGRVFSKSLEDPSSTLEVRSASSCKSNFLRVKRAFFFSLSIFLSCFSRMFSMNLGDVKRTADFDDFLEFCEVSNVGTGEIKLNTLLGYFIDSLGADDLLTASSWENSESPFSCDMIREGPGSCRSSGVAFVS